MTPRNAEIAFGLSMITVIGAVVLVVSPLSLPFFLAGICLGWGFHAGVTKNKAQNPSTTKAEG